METIILTAKHFQQNSNTHSIKNKKIEFSNLKETTSNIFLPSIPHQIILGSLLGDMHCKKEVLNSNIQEYHQRPNVKERMRENLRRYRQKPEYKEKAIIYKREYRRRPEVKEKILAYNKKYRERKKGGKD